MIIVIEITDDLMKSAITEKILRQLPEWFGLEASILEYIQNVKQKLLFAAYDGETVVGFICISYHNEFTAELYLTGILKPYHRKGIGKELVARAEKRLVEENYKMFMVKTLGESVDCEEYHRTRAFYRSVGFYPLEEFSQIWDEENPCLIMVKSL
jgi:ribosomal protein S18 acetylase RimI-like enzyme